MLAMELVKELVRLLVIQLELLLAFLLDV